jgi:SAM-dependent methyltransferase
MSLFGWFRRQRTEQAPGVGAQRRWLWLGGRRVLADTPYIMPKDALEGERLDLQHHLLKLAGGGNYRAPLRQPHTILDVACGTGIWGREMALQFKRAQVTGFDIDRTPLEASRARLGPMGQFPANFQFLEGDALQPFQFADAQFDFTHMRFVGSFISAERWPQVIAEMVRVTKPGGYIEVVELEGVESRSQALTVLKEAGRKLMDGRGLHQYPGAYLAGYLRGAGLARVQERRVVLGAGQQAARQQRLLGADMIAIFANLQGIMVKVGLFSEAEYSRLLEQLRTELPQVGLTMPIVYSFSVKL